jgi:hypothetical protein
VTFDGGNRCTNETSRVVPPERAIASGAARPKVQIAESRLFRPINAQFAETVRAQSPSAHVGWLRQPLRRGTETRGGRAFDVALPFGRALLPTNGVQPIQRTESISLPSDPM